MKISKLIIPLLGLTSITNDNKQELLKIEKISEISYEVLASDKWDNYYCLTNANTIDKNIMAIFPRSGVQNIFVNNGKKPTQISP